MEQVVELFTLWKPRSSLSSVVNIKSTDELVVQKAKPSAVWPEYSGLGRVQPVWIHQEISQS